MYLVNNFDTYNTYNINRGVCLSAKKYVRRVVVRQWIVVAVRRVRVDRCIGLWVSVNDLS